MKKQARVNTDDAVQDTTTDVGNTNNSSTTNQTAYYDDVSFNIYSTEQIVLLHGLPLHWLLLDSCSTTDIFANASLLSGLHIACTPILVRCNAGQIQLTEQNYFGNHPYPVWYTPKGVANILSLANVTKHYRVTMYSNTSAAIVVHKSNGTSISFKPMLVCIDGRKQRLWKNKEDTTSPTVSI